MNPGRGRHGRPCSGQPQNPALGRDRTKIDDLGVYPALPSPIFETGIGQIPARFRVPMASGRWAIEQTQIVRTMPNAGAQHGDGASFGDISAAGAGGTTTPAPTHWSVPFDRQPKTPTATTTSLGITRLIGGRPGHCACRDAGMRGETSQSRREMPGYAATFPAETKPQSPWRPAGG